MRGSLRAPYRFAAVSVAKSPLILATNAGDAYDRRFWRSRRKPYTPFSEWSARAQIALFAVTFLAHFSFLILSTNTMLNLTPKRPLIKYQLSFKMPVSTTSTPKRK